MIHRTTGVLSILVLFSGFAAVRAGPPRHEGPPLERKVEAALGTEPDEVIRALKDLVVVSARGDLAGGPEIAVATILVVLRREHWVTAPRGDEVRLQAMEALAACGGPQALAGLERFAGPAALAARAQAVAARMRSMDNLRGLLSYYLQSGVGVSKPWPPYGGKRLVLWLVAANVIDRRDERALAILFSPADVTRSLAKAGGTQAFASIAKDTLRDPAFDAGPMTSYAGRRNDEKAHVLDAAELVRDAPVLVDHSFPDGVLFASPRGAVRWVSREELGIPAGVPIVVGDESPNEDLKHFSDR